MLDLPVLIGYVLFVGNHIYREMFLRFRGEAKKISGGSFDKGSTMLSMIVILMILFSPSLLGYLQIAMAIPIEAQWFGVALMILGLVIHISSVKTLGRFYSRSLRIQKHHYIVQNGPYKFVRHPGYLGTIITELGFGLACGNLYASFLIVLIMIPMYTFRIRQEEKMLKNSFGNAYAHYAQKTKLLVPLIY